MRRALFVVFFTGSIFASPYFTNGFVKPGTYEFVGKDIQGAPYSGRLIIETCGENYKVTWKENFRVLSTGIGILRGEIFSVSFCDLDGSNGIVSYEMISNYEMEGGWARMNGESRGIERLNFISPNLD